MCKLCGFADHSHTATPCTKCTVTHDEFFTEKSLRNGEIFTNTIYDSHTTQPEFPARSGEEHRRLCYRYRDLSSEEDKNLFFSMHGVRWTEFARLDYFDLVKYTVIDPMHNLLLGECVFGLGECRLTLTCYDL